MLGGWIERPETRCRSHLYQVQEKAIKKPLGIWCRHMARLSNTFFFVPSQDDAEFIKRKPCKKLIWMKMIYQCPKVAIFQNAGRHHIVPGPAVKLEREFKKVVQLFASLSDAKTSKSFFFKDTWNLYESTLKHIQEHFKTHVKGMHEWHACRACPTMYNFRQIWWLYQLSSAFGAPTLWKDSTQRYVRHAVALLHKFVYRWNHDVDAWVMELLAKYSKHYEGWVIQDEIEEILGRAPLSTASRRPEPARVIISHNRYFTYSSWRWSLGVRKIVRDGVLC